MQSIVMSVSVCLSVRLSAHISRKPHGQTLLKSVTHGQCDVRPTVTFPAEDIAAVWQVPNYTAWW